MAHILGKGVLSVKRLIFNNIIQYYRNMKNPKRTTLLINLSVEEADRIRAAAKKQDRTISAYVLRAVMASIKIQEQIEGQDGYFDKYLQRARGERG